MTRQKELIELGDERGLTLIEVIAAIVLITVILLSVFTILTNSFNFNAMNDHSTQAMNIAREQESLIHNLSWGEIIPDSTNENGFTNHDKKPGYYKKQFTINNNGEYQITINVKKNPELGRFYRELHEVHIEVRKEGKLVSETFTYHEGNVVSP
ncbi:prepilin-type N-terminal cleavage/methylation domain-containing protein [Ureibacillus sp. GCM10028918]|uniref:type IV pilus modification PilV family protein n=1 Tax=Ureibacillus sp. GCM10028918 TaxID=3273429 RepID=UPI00361552FC